MAEDEKYSQVACEGDSGGGLVIAQMRGNDKQFYLQGVVSNSPRINDRCTTSYYTLFTNVQYYKDFPFDVVNHVR